MGCEDIRKDMASFLSGELSAPQNDEIREHLMRCEGCQKELDAYKETWNILDSWEGEDPDRGYVSRFWMRLASERSWQERLADILSSIFADKRFVPALSAVCILVVAGFFVLRTTQAHQTEVLLTALSIEEIEFVENLELAENFEFLEQMEMLEQLDILDELSLKDRGPRNENV